MRQKEFCLRFVKLFSVSVVVKAGSFLLLPIYLRLMTPEEFGRYSYLWSVVGMLAFVFGMGQHVTLSRFFHTAEYTRKELVENVHLVLFTSILVFSVVLLVFKSQVTSLLFKYELLDTSYYIAILLAILLAFNQIFMIFLYQSEQVNLVLMKNIFDFLCINTIALAALYFVDFSADDVRIASMIVAHSIIIVVFYHRLFNAENIRFSARSFPIYKRFLKNGAPIAIGAFANFFISFGDRFVIEKLLDDAKLGVFSFAMVITGTLMLIFNSFQNVWLPYLFKEKNLDISIGRVYKIIILFAGISTLAGLGFYPLVYILGNYFIDRIYLDSLGFLWLLVIAVFFQIVGMFIAGFYQIFEKNHISVPINIGAGFLNIAMNYYLIAKYQLLGAAIATALISFMLFAIHFTLVHFYKNRRNFGEYFSTH